MTVGTCSCGEVFRDDNPLNQPGEAILFHERAGHGITLWNQGCGRKLGPFDCCTVVCGDCLELMKQLPDGCVDGVITDPPYPRLEYGWVPAKPELFRRLASHQFWFWMNSEPFPVPTTCFHVWSKANVYIGDCELFEIIWEVGGSRLGSVLRYSAINSEMSAQLNRDEFWAHPCQKPFALMERLVKKVHGSIFDPYCGTGTTLVAAKKLGRHFLGFEISPEYCEIARKRIALVEAQPTLFEKKPEQLEL